MTHPRKIIFFSMRLLMGKLNDPRDCHLQCLPGGIFSRNEGARGPIARGINTASPKASFIPYRDTFSSPWVRHRIAVKLR